MAFLSKNLSNLYSLKRSDNFKAKFLEQELVAKNRFFKSKQMFATAFLSLFLLLGFTSVVSAQKSLPGEPLYPIKRLSENIAETINPSFKNEIVKRRSEEIKELSGKDKSKHLNEAINDYEKELNDNQKINLENIKQSELNLEEARQSSISAENKLDIERVLIKTQERQKTIQEVKGDSISSPLDINKDEQNKDSGSEQQKIITPLEH